jgi:hypothetical protein
MPSPATVTPCDPEVLALATGAREWLASRMYRVKNLDAFDDPSALFGLLTDEPHLTWSVRELETHLGWDAVRVVDCVSDLERDGLAHRLGSFIFPTRAAVRSRELLA